MDADYRALGLSHPLRLSPQQIQRLQDASLEVMERTGMRFGDPEAVELFQKAGARISDGNIVHIRPALTEWALRCAPKNVTIYDRNGKRRLELGRSRCYYGVGSDCAHLYDIQSGQRRPATLSDLRQAIRLADALPNVDFIMSMVLPADVPLGRHEPWQLAAMLNGTVKPIVFVGESARSTHCAVEMATAISGNREQLSRAPFIINYVNTVSALDHNADSVQRLLYAAGLNLPTVYGPAHTHGTTAPMTPAGAVALGNAGQLAGLVLSQLKREGSPFIRAVPGGDVIDMGAMVDCYVAPDDGIMGWDLARSQQLPIFGTGGCSDAKIFDAQAAAEAALSLFANTINGANLVHDLGYLDCAMTYSFELLALCDEIISWQKRYLQAPQINEETLALDLIHEAGHKSAYLEAEHTLKYVRSGWRPTLFDRTNHHRWHTSGEQTFQQRAREKVVGILSDHRPEPLPEEIVNAIEAVRNVYCQSR